MCVCFPHLSIWHETGKIVGKKHIYSTWMAFAYSCCRYVIPTYPKNWTIHKTYHVVKKKSFMFEKTTASERLVYIGIGINLLWHLRRPDSDFDGFFSSLSLCVLFFILFRITWHLFATESLVCFCKTGFTFVPFFYFNRVTK